MSSLHTRALWLFLASLTLAAGGLSCSTKDQEARKPVFPVKGQVFFKDKPAFGAFVVFVPVNEPADAKDPRPHAEVDKDGNFVVGTYDAADGAPAGEYQLMMTWPGGVLPDGREEPDDKFGGRYANPKTSKLTAKVVEGPNELPAFKLK
jgi:hypothetical protein